jgi:AI-2 transport protein TqsA
MTFFGLELAVAMGVLTFVLNFIPNVGSIVATIAVGLVAYVQTGDLVTGVAVLGIVMVIQFIVGQVLDPLFLGKTLRLSSFGIIASLAFWAAVWGIPGMFLAVPIMVSVMIVCSHIPGLRPVAVILSREGCLIPISTLMACPGAAKCLRPPKTDRHVLQLLWP